MMHEMRFVDGLKKADFYQTRVKEGTIMTRKMRLSDVDVGKNFEIWGHAYTVLEEL